MAMDLFEYRCRSKLCGKIVSAGKIVPVCCGKPMTKGARTARRVEGSVNVDLLELNQLELGQTGWDEAYSVQFIELEGGSPSRGVALGVVGRRRLGAWMAESAVGFPATSKTARFKREEAVADLLLACGVRHASDAPSRRPLSLDAEPARQ